MTPWRRLAPLVLVLLALAAAISSAQQPATGFLVLLTNDDGYDAPGLQALVRAFAGYGEIYISAPRENQSGKGHSITTSDPIFVNERRQAGVVAAWAVEAPPATSARIGLDKLVPRPPDVVISGINRGENLGQVVYLSGTLGAAREAVFSGAPAIAVSMEGNDLKDYERTAAYLRSLVEKLRADRMLAAGLFLNVNAPRGEWKGVRVTRLSMKYNPQIFERRTSLRGRVYFWSDYTQIKDDAEDTDIGAFFRGYVTLTPMTLDATQTIALAELKKFEQGK
jgi:5'-nucleotidase